MNVLDDLRSGALAGARSLDLSNLGLRTVPSEVFALSDTLDRLDLAGNALTDLPLDMERLGKLEVLFCSRNPFERLPSVLGACPALEQVGFRDCGLRDLPAEALPPRLRWLTLTDNRLERVPSELGACSRLQKLMLAGNRLRSVPDTLAGADTLELLRLSANDLEALPDWLTEMPRLAWLAFAGNPLDAAGPDLAAAETAVIAWTELELGEPLGEGASGRVHRAVWLRNGGAPGREVAVKLFKGAMTSDGLPACEMAAALAVGDHPTVMGAIGRIIGHPTGCDGLVLPLLPPGWRPLAGPPSRASCSRDVYPETMRLPQAAVLNIARDTADATARLHRGGVLHGDLYAHNTLWDGTRGRAALSDFGAAAIMPGGAADPLRRLDVLAWGILFGELLDHSETGDLAAARALQARCCAASPPERPGMPDIVAALDEMARFT